MNSLPKIFFGIFLTFVFAWGGLVAMPYLQLGNLQPVDTDGELAPPGKSGLAEYGARIYASEGCVYCHSQQVRPAYAGSDLDRGWGTRRTVPRDYIKERPTFLGTMRTGPDLSNIGRRQPSEAWHHKHLYAPRADATWSTMPAFRYLYKVQKIKGQPSVDALELGPKDAPPAGYEVVPSYEAKALVAYLVSLDRGYALPEAPVD